jgi:hypothetical protein
MKRHSTSLVLILFIIVIFNAHADATEPVYKLEISINLNTFALQGFGSITLDSAPPENRLVLNRWLNESTMLQLGTVSVNSSPVTAQATDRSFVLDLSGISGPYEIEFDWRISDLPEYEGIILLDDNKYDGTEFAWYPRISGSKPDLTVSLLIQGEGRLASNATFSSFEDIGGMSEYELKAENSLILYLSPIFTQINSFSDGTSISVFMREGADSWKSRILGNVAEIMEFYRAAIPAYYPERLDVVIAGREYSQGNRAPGIVVIKDVIDAYVDDLGAVFTGHYLRWQLSVKMAGAWFASQIELSDNSIPWLVDGLSLHFANEYARAVLLGGPAFDNIKQQYLNAAKGDENLSLSQSRDQAGSLLPLLSESKGFWIVGMLRQQMGKREFESWVDLLTGHQGRLNNAIIEEYATRAAGKNMKPFFENWVYGDSRLDLNLVEADKNSSGVSLELENTADLAVKADIVLSLETGQDVVRQVDLKPGTNTLSLETDSPVRRVRVDPERQYPDVDRGNNTRSFGSTAAIEQLYAIDNLFTIGDIEITGEPVKSGRQRVTEFQMTITNRQETDASIGLHLTTAFPGGRNRGVSKIFIQLAAGETQTVRDLLFMPALGYGPMTIKAEYFVVRSREQFEQLNRRSDPTLVSWYTYGIEKE